MAVAALDSMSFYKFIGLILMNEFWLAEFKLDLLLKIGSYPSGKLFIDSRLLLFF